MMSTGDVRGCLRQLEGLLRVLKYPGHADFTGLSKGDPSAFLPIVSFTLTSFSAPLADHLVTAGFELSGKTDLRFTDTLYKVLRDVFHYKPVLTKQQFLQWGFSQRKLSMVCDIINLVLNKHSQLRKPKIRGPVAHREGVEVPRNPTVYQSPFVVSHVERVSSSSSHENVVLSTEGDAPSHHVSVFSSGFSQSEIIELSEEGEATGNGFLWSQVEERFLALEAKLDGLTAALGRMAHLDKRLDELERERCSNKTTEQVISVSRESWENLQSRVLLLETKLELNHVQTVELVQSQNVTCFDPSSSITEPSKEETEERLERISNMLRRTSSLLKNSDSSWNSAKEH